jgi:NAD(P)-dependent dehydrogenase (short-subunit alcohol dehydrogenase family)
MQETMQLNFLSNWYLLRGCHQLLQKSNAGRVVFVSSSNAYGGFPEWSAYAASKAALDRVMAAYASENEGSAIRCNSLSPGPVCTDMGLFANKGDVNGMVDASAIMPLFDLLTSSDLKHTGKMFEFRHFHGMQPLEVWSMRRY